MPGQDERAYRYALPCSLKNKLTIYEAKYKIEKNCIIRRKVYGVGGREMKISIVLTGILRDKDLFLIIKRSEDDDRFPGAWEFPGGHLEDGETLIEGLLRELKEEIGYYDDEIKPIITNYTDEIIKENNEKIYNLEIDFIVNVDKEKIKVRLSNEHTDYKWVEKESEYLDDYIKSKLVNI